MWEVIQPAEEGKLEVSYRWFRTCKDEEDWCMTDPDAGDGGGPRANPRGRT